MNSVSNKNIFFQDSKNFIDKKYSSQEKSNLVYKSNLQFNEKKAYLTNNDKVKKKLKFDNTYDEIYENLSCQDKHITDEIHENLTQENSTFFQLKKDVMSELTKTKNLCNSHNCPNKLKLYDFQKLIIELRDEIQSLKFVNSTLLQQIKIKEEFVFNTLKKNKLGFIKDKINILNTSMNSNGSFISNFNNNVPSHKFSKGKIISNSSNNIGNITDINNSNHISKEKYNTIQTNNTISNFNCDNPNVNITNSITNQNTNINSRSNPYNKGNMNDMTKNSNNNINFNVTGNKINSNKNLTQIIQKKRVSLSMNKNEEVDLNDQKKSTRKNLPNIQKKELNSNSTNEKTNVNGRKSTKELIEVDQKSEKIEDLQEKGSFNKTSFILKFVDYALQQGKEIINLDNEKKEEKVEKIQENRENYLKDLKISNNKEEKNKPDSELKSENEEIPIPKVKKNFKELKFMTSLKSPSRKKISNDNIENEELIKVGNDKLNKNFEIIYENEENKENNRCMSFKEEEKINEKEKELNSSYEEINETRFENKFLKDYNEGKDKIIEETSENILNHESQIMNFNTHRPVILNSESKLSLPYSPVRKIIPSENQTFQELNTPNKFNRQLKPMNSLNANIPSRKFGMHTFYKSNSIFPNFQSNLNPTKQNTNNNKIPNINLLPTLNMNIFPHPAYLPNVNFMASKYISNSNSHYNKILGLFNRIEKGSKTSNNRASFLGYNDTVLKRMCKSDLISEIGKLTNNDDEFLACMRTFPDDKLLMFCDLISTLVKDFQYSVQLIRRIKTFLDISVKLVHTTNIKEAVRMIISNCNEVLSSEGSKIYVYDKYSKKLLVHGNEDRVSHDFALTCKEKNSNMELNFANLQEININGINNSMIKSSYANYENYSISTAKISPGEGIVGWVYKNNQRQKIDDALTDNRFFNAAEAKKITI